MFTEALEPTTTTAASSIKQNKQPSTTPNMSEAGAKAPKGWTDEEKVAIYFQIISKMDKPIPWKELEVPEGRTLKAVQVMMDKEKTKIRKAREAEGKDMFAPSTPSEKKTPKKRTAKDTEADGEVKETPKKKKATPKSKKSIAKADDEDNEEAADKSPVKTDSGGEDEEMA